MALLPLGATALISRRGSSQSVRRRALLVGVTGSLVLLFLAAIGLSHVVWGYFLSRPAVDRRIVEASKIQTVTSVESRSDPTGGRTFAGGSVSNADALICLNPQEGDIMSWKGECWCR